MELNKNEYRKIRRAIINKDWRRDTEEVKLRTRKG